MNVSIPPQLRGMAFFPLYQNQKAPQIKWRDYNGDAFEDPNRTGIAIDCERSDIVVIDVDMHGEVDGISTWIALKEQLSIPETFTVATAGGGYHYYFTDDEGGIRNSAGKLGEGIDVRGAGGCIVAPGSKVKIADGSIKEYEVLLDEPLIPLPQALRELLATPSKSKQQDSKVAPLQGEVLPASEDEIPAEAMAKHIMALYTAPEGKRNNTLNEVAYKLASEGASKAFLEKRLAPIAISVGLTDDEVLGTIESAHSAATKKAMEQEVKGHDADFTDVHGYYTDAVLSTRFGKQLRREHWTYLNGENRWCRYNATTGIWEPVTNEDLLERTKKWCVAEVKRAVSSTDKEKIRIAMRCLGHRSIRNIADLVRLECKISPQVFDADSHLIACENGVVDLKNNKLLPHDPKLYMTKRIPIPYDPSVKSKYLDAILEALPEDAIGWFISMAGQSLTGEQPSSDRMFFMNGIGANGKSTILNLMAATAGDYGGHPSQSSLIRQRGNNDEYNLMMYKGLHQAIVEEMPDKQLDTIRMKALIGTDMVTARQLYKDQVSFQLNCTIWVSCNILPQVVEYDHGTWRRIALIPFNKVYKDSERDITQPHHRLGKDAVRKAAKHDRDTHIQFFTMRVDAAYEWYSRGGVDMPLPQSVIDATGDWRRKGDNIQLWFTESIKKDDSTISNFILIEDLRDSYNRWLSDHGYAGIAHKSFIDRFSNHNVFMDNNLVCMRGRVAQYTQSQWSDPTKSHSVGYTPRVAGEIPTHVKGIAFKKE